MGIAVWGWIMQHQVLLVMGGQWCAVYAVASLPSPTQSSNGFYKWFFAFSHGIIGALPRLLPQLRLPSDPSRNGETFFSKPAYMNGKANTP